ncbi:uracil-DNA glycosylase family protein [Bermanella marisrubri]|uniref:Putative uracil-DNA glycosylase family protein n=1 Tax=Bermanella marisrubri TaxID=207949 RepID=Q1MYG8_9GAMM|nr:uracil-DNA glycosylase family protein [Bermanella marisrubri]EAT10977.1 putative uracil-DNA glycosylase family protein [Oceanobacter sp. RED65] [Bermanella marisrubri]QIZ83777.1 uracil-DNA glycosylase family protein [Bermanella marisrubri]
MSLHAEIQHCLICQSNLPLPPRPVLQFSQNSNILIIGQAPGQKAHHAHQPFKDASGKRLREWLGLTESEFYDADKVALMPMAFCYPGKGKSGDLPPPPICHQTWHKRLLDHMQKIQLVVLLGQYSQRHYLTQATDFPWLKPSESERCQKLYKQYNNLADRVANQSTSLPESIMALPHPSPRNQLWLKKNPWFEQQVIPILQQRVIKALHHE